MVDISGWLPNFPLLGGGLSVDLVYNLVSGELILLPSGYGMGGIGAGGANSPSLVLVYDAPNNDALTWGSGGGQGNITNGIGIKASYSSSQTKGETGQYAQVYTIGPSFGVGGSLSGFYNFTPWNLKIFP